MQHYICDRASYRVTRREYTDEGFLRVPGNVARVGIQDYLARELGLPGNPNRIVKVYRPAEEVFHADSLASFDGVDVTINHPDGLVNSSNYKKVSAGVVRGTGRVVDGFVQCDLIVKDQAAIDAINSGKCELSAGYTAVYDDTPGTTPEGEPYDFIQREIRINHVALVDRARAGANARVFDHSNGGAMPVLITTDSGRAIDVADPANAQLVADSFDRLNAALKQATADAESAQAVADARAEELAAAKQLTSDAAIAERVKAIAAVQAVATRISGETCDSVDILTIQRAALAKVRPTVDWAAKSEAYVQAAFDMAAEKEDDEEDVTCDAGGRPKTKPSKDSGELLKQLAQLAQDAAGVPNGGGKTETVDHYAAFKAKQANAWKGE